MSTIRIKVQLGEEKSQHSYYDLQPLKFVYIIDSPSAKTVADLIRVLQQYIIETLFTDNIHIIQLMTDDGYILPNSDTCSAVFKDNDRIICIDMKKFVKNNERTLKEKDPWVIVKQYDSSDDREKGVLVGINCHGKLFVKMLRAINSFELYLFSISELLVIAREKRTNTLVARLDSINDTDHVSESSAWFGEANWEYDSVSPTILFIVCSVKVGSNDQLWSSKLSIILDRHCMRIRKGDLTHLASNEEELKKQQYAYYKDLVEQLPPPKRTGPEIPITKIQSQEVVTYECEGDSVVRMHCGNKNTIITKQEHGFRDDETFLQYFTITNIVISRDPSIVPNISQQKHSVSTNNRLSITRFVVMYQAHDTLWHECDQVKIAPSTRYGEPDWYRDITLNIEPDKTISLTIQGMIVVNGEIGMDSDGRSQLHNSLPQPFKTKIIIHDNTGKQCSLIVEQWNKPIQVITRESFVERDHNSIKELLAFIYVDDCNVDKRIFAAAYLDYRHRLVIHVNNSPRTLELQHVRTLEFYARQNGFLESSLSADHYRSSDIQCNAIGLFDSKTYMLYAIRFELATKTSTYEETIPLPLDKIQ